MPDTVKQGITYEQDMIFHLVAGLYFSLQELDPSFAEWPSENDLPLDDIDEEEFTVVLDAPFPQLQEAFWTFQEKLFCEQLKRYEALIVPLCANVALKKEFEAWCLKEHNVPIILKQRKGKTRLTVVPNEPPKE